MAYNYPKVVQNGDGTFGPTNVQHFYKPIVYHNRGAVKKDEKSRWCLKRNEQYEVFRLADEGVWMDTESNGLYSIVDNGKEVLGKRGSGDRFLNHLYTNKKWHVKQDCIQIAESIRIPSCKGQQVQKMRKDSSREWCVNLLVN